MARKLKRFQRGSPEAKRYMARLRKMKSGGTIKRRWATYTDGVFNAHHKKKIRSALSKLGLI
ncbi:MAG: hypothetical protein ABR936_11980 [Bacteroidota bacterium]|jgi:hypothetical protein